MTRLGWDSKGLPARAERFEAGELAQLRLSLLDGDLLMPAAVLRARALSSNIRKMQDFADSCGVKLCPHGKTSMSPELFRMQLQAGAWGITAATAHHVRIYRRLGIGRIFLANQLAARADIAFILGEIAADPEFDFYCLADSAAGIDLLADAAAAAACPAPLKVLVEAGVQGARSGVRTAAEGVELARHIARRGPWLTLVGVETFEGVRQTAPDARAEASGMIAMAVEIAQAAGSEGLFGDGALILSAGGSAFLDLCTAGLPSEIGGSPVQRVIRPGCYVTHDSGLYRRITQPYGEPLPGLPRLEHALEVWGVVQSLPEPGLAIVGIGKRDVSYDIEPPIPLWVHRPQSGSAPREAVNLEVRALWDQHVSLAGQTENLGTGDLVGFGISHPCSTFDRWRSLFTVDDYYRVTGAVTTLF